MKIFFHLPAKNLALYDAPSVEVEQTHQTCFFYNEIYWLREGELQKMIRLQNTPTKRVCMVLNQILNQGVGHGRSIPLYSSAGETPGFVDHLLVIMEIRSRVRNHEGIRFWGDYSRKTTSGCPDASIRCTHRGR